MTAAVLWIASEVSATPRSGGHLRTARLIQALTERTTVDLLTFGPSSTAQELQQALGVREVEQVSGPTGLAARVLAVRRGWPLAVARGWSARAADVAEHAAARGSRIVLDFSTAGAYRPSVGNVIYNLHNAEYARLRDMPSPQGAARRLERAREIRAMTRWERKLGSDTNARFVTVSSADAQLLGITAHVIPNGADIPDVPPPPPATGPPMFVGSLDYPPNLDAVMWWSTSIWPLLEGSSLPLQVVGRTGPVNAPLPGVELLGEVADPGPHLTAAAITVVPLRSGGGTRLKILEALAWERPVVTTTKGAEGLSSALLDVVQLADDPAGIAACVRSLLPDVARREVIGQRGRAAVAPYAWGHIGADFARVVLDPW